MSQIIQIPIFPLNLLPLPGELVPLHIFEPRYQQLLRDAVDNDIEFGIFFNHEINENKIGSLMKLERIIKQYTGGEADIVVKCSGMFNMHMLYRTFNDKKYPGGDVQIWEVDSPIAPSKKLADVFSEYMLYRNIKPHELPFNHYQMASELNLDLADRYKFLLASDKRESFLNSQLNFQLHLLKQEEKSKHVFHLN